MQAALRSEHAQTPWQDVLFEGLKRGGIRQVPYVPDAGHSHVIRRAQAEVGMKAYPLTTEEEGIAALCGAWLGGERGVLLMQSSGVGNCINMLSLLASCRFPFLTIVTMRGECGEFNPWQVPMGRATPAVLAAMGVTVHRIDCAEDVANTIDLAIHDAFLSEQQIAVLLSQRLLGRKNWTD
nr:thiamine pyrophosphate-binding protein [Rhodoligotrophos defluvii]